MRRSSTPTWPALFACIERGGATIRRSSAGEFHREFARVRSSAAGSVSGSSSWTGGPAPAWYGFRFGCVESYYQAGRDPTRRRLRRLRSLAHSIREAANDGMREYRFLRGGEPFK